MSMELCKLTVTDLCAMLKDRGVSSEVVDAFQSKSINRDVLEALTDEGIKELASKLSDRVAVRRIWAKYQGCKPFSQVRS